MLPTSMSAPVLVDKQAVLSAAEPALPSVSSQGSVPDYWYSSTAPASPAHGTLYQRLSYVDDHSTASPLPPSLGLPQSQADSWTDCLSASQSPSRFWAEYLRRIFQLSSMDIENTFFQMFHLCSDPQRVYRIARMHESAKKHWARDDPAFTLILVYFLAVSSFAYAVAFNEESLWNLLRIIVSTILVDFLLIGLLVATATWMISNILLRSSSAVSSDTTVEWLYAFDIHCNSFFPFFLIIYVVQYFFLPFFLSSSYPFFSALLANALYAAAFSVYFHHTFLGFNALRIVENPAVFLYPILPIVLLLLVSLLFNFNCSVWMINTNFAVLQ